MIENFLSALALVFVLEGLLPFLFPGRFRQTLETISKLDDRTLRTLSLLSMLIGVGILYFVHHLLS